jgi:diamine N-acetyltransferase
VGDDSIRRSKVIKMIVLTKTIPDDIDYVTAAESDADTATFIIPWTPERHLEAMKDADCAHLIIRRSSDGNPVGFVLLFGLTSHHSAIELRRIVAVKRGAGIGRAALRAVKSLAFGEHRAHRLWLDVKTTNLRARRLYRSEGFVEEGVLRECLREAAGFESLVVMSILRSEYEGSL